jgi:hypothetical protein
MSAAKQRVLATTVHVNGEVYEAGTSVPADVAELISNPKAWADGVEAPAQDEASKSDQGKEKADSAPVEPPRSGPGSGDKAWVTYGEAIGLDVSTGKKADIIAALDAKVAADKANAANSDSSSDAGNGGDQAAQE